MMRFNEFNSKIDETRVSGRQGNKQTRYNTEVGLLVGFLGIDPNTFDPANPEASIPQEAVSTTVFKEIKKFLAPNFNANMFAEWVAKAGPYAGKIASKVGKAPTQFDWAGGSNINADGAADIEFIDLPVHGLSVKAESGITLSNLTPKALGLEVERGNDIFYQYAGEEYQTMKTAIFNAVMDEAESKAGQSLGWHRETPEKYSITYNGPAVQQKEPAVVAQQPNELDAIKKNAGIPAQPPTKNTTSLQGTDFTSASSRQQVPADAVYEDVKQPVEGTFTITGKRNFSGTREQILAASGKNAPWQRVFGDWFQANYASQKQLATPLFQAVAEVFRTTIVSHLSKDRKLDAILRMSKNPYFYCNADDIYYVPSIDEVTDLVVKKVYYGSISGEGEEKFVKEAEGTSQKFQAEIGRPDSEQNAKILIYIRYANGMFEANPTVRVQDLRDAEFLGWEKL